MASMVMNILVYVFYQLLLPKYYDKVIMSRLHCIQAGHRQLLIDNLSGYNLLQTQITNNKRPQLSLA